MSCTLALGTGDDTVWANVGAVVNSDNEVDAPEGVAFTGQITGKVTIFPSGGSLVVPDLSKNKQASGPGVPLIYVTNGKFFPDPMGAPVIRTSPPSTLPSSGETATFNSTFRLPFKVAKDGAPAKPERGKNAYYRADDGSLIKVDKQDEFALGFPLLRAEVFFTTP